MFKSTTTTYIALFLAAASSLAADSRAEGLSESESGTLPQSRPPVHEDPIFESEMQLYRAVSSDLQQGKPLVVTTFVNLQYNGGRPPLTSNMYWGGGYGYFSFFELGSRNKMYKRRFGKLAFHRILLAERKSDPIRAAVFKSTFIPKGRLAAPGDKPAELILVNLAWKQGMDGLVAAVRAAIEGKGSFRFRTDEGTAIDAVHDARIIGFVGHNPRFDTHSTQILERIRTSDNATDRPRGSFAIGCMTAGPSDVRLSPYLIGENTAPLLFTGRYVSAEAYSFLGMVSAFIEGKSLLEISKRANDEYQAFQRHHNGRGGRPFLAPNRIRIPQR